MQGTKVTVSRTALLVFLLILAIVLMFVFVHSGAKEVYRTCTQAKAAGKGNFTPDDPNYNISLDRDHDQLACEL